MVRSPEPGRSARHQRRHGDRRETRSFAERAVELRRSEICAGLLQDLIGGAKLPHLAFQFLDPVLLRARQTAALTGITFGLLAPDAQAVGNWFNLDILAIYDNLNPVTKKGQQDQRAWRKSAIDSNGKAITSVGIIANRLLKILTGKKFIPDTPLNSKLQSKKAERQQQLQDFLAMGSNPPALLIVQKFLSENICIPVNADGIAIDPECVTVNIGARIIMLAVEPDSYLALNDIFAAPTKEAWQAQIDDKNLSFNEKWDSLADCFMNADDFLPENEWANMDSHIQDVHPRQPPITPWSGEQLRKHFRTLKTKFALVDECFCRSGNLEAGADIDEADRFDGQIRRLLPSDTAEVHTLLLFAFWAFNKKPPKFISRAKPEKDQFDTSSSASTAPPTRKKFKTTSNAEALAQAVSSLAPSKEEQEQRMLLLAEETRHKRNQENREYLSWKRSECEKFLGQGITLPEDIKDKMQEKMAELAAAFLKENL